MVKDTQKRIVSVLVHNWPNVMTRVASVIGRRGLNIDTITVSSTNDPDTTRITMVINVEKRFLNQIILQIERMEVVKAVTVLSRDSTMYREMVLCKLSVGAERRDAVMTVIKDGYRGKIIELRTHSITVEVTGSPEKIDGFLEIMKEFDIVDYCRSGVLAVERYEKPASQRID